MCLQQIYTDGADVVPDVWQVLDKIKSFTDKVRDGTWLGATGKPLTDVVAIGIGGSFLGPLFVHTALRTEQTAGEEVCGRLLPQSPHTTLFPGCEAPCVRLRSLMAPVDLDTMQLEAMKLGPPRVFKPRWHICCTLSQRQPARQPL